MTARLTAAELSAWTCACGETNAPGLVWCPVCGRSGSVARAMLADIGPSGGNCPPLGQGGTASASGGARPRRTRGTGEAPLQTACEQWLRQHDVEYLHLSPRAREHRGWPDLTFALRGMPCAVELKGPGGVVSADQAACLERLAANGWRVAVLRSLPEVCDWCRAILEPPPGPPQPWTGFYPPG